MYDLIINTVGNSPTIEQTGALRRFACETVRQAWHTIDPHGYEEGIEAIIAGEDLARRRTPMAEGLPTLQEISSISGEAARVARKVSGYMQHLMLATAECSSPSQEETWITPGFESMRGIASTASRAVEHAREAVAQFISRKIRRWDYHHSEEEYKFLLDLIGEKQRKLLHYLLQI